MDTESAKGVAARTEMLHMLGLLTEATIASPAVSDHKA
jgi:hypothetical protein